MESEIIAECFANSIEDHGLKYKTVICDGDSSVYKTILDNNFYRDYNIQPQRVRCYNHLQRNLCKKLKTISETTQPRGTERVSNFVSLRNVIKNNSSKFRRLVEDSVDARRLSSKEWITKVEDLRLDLLNIPNHVFGNHQYCENRGYGCIEKALPEEERGKNYVDDLKSIGLYQQVEEALLDLSHHSESLLHKMTNNLAEFFHSLVCLEIGGKRINFCLKSSYATRVYAAIIRHNTQQLLTQAYKRICGVVPEIVERLDRSRQDKVTRNRQRTALRGQKRRYRNQGVDGKYGPQAQKPDMSDEQFAAQRQLFLTKLRSDQEERHVIQQRTVLQQNSPEWHAYRRNLLTSSNFHLVCRGVDSARKIQQVLYPSANISNEMQWGIDNEARARADLEKLLSLKTIRCGLFIDEKHAFLGSSPDALIVGDDDVIEGIVEIKCPAKGKNSRAQDLVSTDKNWKSVFFLRDENENDVYEMRTICRFYMQVQGQLHITNLPYCIFAIWTPKSIICARVERDKEFWEKKMEPRLVRFFMECMLPELIDRRFTRNMAIREPAYVIEARETKRMKKDQVKKQKNQCLASDLKSIETKQETPMECRNSEQSEAVSYSGKMESSSLMKNTDSSHTNNDVEITVEFLSNPRDRSVRELANLLTYIEDRPIPFEEVRSNVLSNSNLAEDSLDSFLRIVQALKPEFSVQSTSWLNFRDLVSAAAPDKLGLAIIGADCWKHWRVVFYDTVDILLYDSLLIHTAGRLKREERDYLKRRFPQARGLKIMHVTQQPDGVSCGVYAAAMVRDLVHGIDPCSIRYSRDAASMRFHFINVIETGELLEFPREIPR